jgi:hypothetical protein
MNKQNFHINNFAVFRALSKLHQAKRKRTMSTTEEPPNYSEFDVRCELFETIPEPVQHPKTYQKVIVTETGDPIDEDTRQACAQLKTCIDIRNKWMKLHPDPPQDERKGFDDLEKSFTVSDIRKMKCVNSDNLLSRHVHEIDANQLHLSNIYSNNSSNSNDTKITNNSNLSETLSSPNLFVLHNHSTQQNTLDGVHPDMFRRRFVPKYQIFERPIPSSSEGFSYSSYHPQMIDGVMTLVGNGFNDNRTHNTHKIGVFSFEEFVSDFKVVRFLIILLLCCDSSSSTYSFYRFEKLFTQVQRHPTLTEN